MQAEPWPLSGLLTFEAVTLKLMEADAEAALVALASSSTSSSNRKAYHQDASDDGAALEVFLEEKLRVSEVGGKVQATMLTTWLLECYLKRLIYLPDPKDSREEVSTHSLKSNVAVARNQMRYFSSFFLGGGGGCSYPVKSIEVLES